MLSKERQRERERIGTLARSFARAVRHGGRDSAERVRGKRRTGGHVDFAHVRSLPHTGRGGAGPCLRARGWLSPPSSPAPAECENVDSSTGRLKDQFKKKFDELGWTRSGLHYTHQVTHSFSTEEANTKNK